LKQLNHDFRIRLSAMALAIAGILFVLYPALRPFSDEVSLQGAAAFASTRWLAAHMLAIVAFTLIPLGLLGLYSSLRETAAERPGYWALVLSMIGIGFTLPFYGGEAYGLHAIGQEAIAQQSAALLSMAGVVRSGAGLLLFIAGLLLLAAGAILAAAAIWKSATYSKWSGIPFAVGIALYLPQFFGTQPLRVTHGLLVAIGCLWIAVGLWHHDRRTEPAAARVSITGGRQRQETAPLHEA
jgi:succinate dehydrogenase hydrophobic anchor subunit